MTTMSAGDDALFDAVREKMRGADQSEEAIRSFLSAFSRVRAGVSTLMASSELEPAPSVPSLDELPDASEPAQALGRARGRSS